MITVIVLLSLFSVIQTMVHFEAKSLGDTRKQRRAAAKMQEKNRLFWSIRNLEEECLGIKWCGEESIDR